MKTLFRFFWLGLAVWLTAEGRSFQAQAAPVTVPPALKKAVKSIDVSVTPAAAARGQTVSWKLTLEMAPGWHTYPTHQSAAGSQDFVNQFEFPNYKDVVFVGRLQEPPSQTHIEGGIVFQSIEGKGTWERPLVVRENAEPGAKEILVPSVLLACDANHCLPPQKVPLQVPLQVKNEQVAVAAQYANEVRQPAGQPTASPGGTPAQPAASTAQQAPAAEDQAPQTASAYQASLVPILQNLVHQQIPSTGLWAFLLAGVFWGAVTLVTPCVFPMIPITVSYFLHHSEKEHHRPLTMALVYCSTIVVVLTIAAVGLLSFFQWLSRNSLMNFALGILFLGFALSLFGMYDLELPSGLARFTSAREGKGGLAGTVFMALTFTIVSFACVAPFLGGFGGAATSSNLTLVDRVLGGLVFSATFASPFFVLALFPSLLKKVPRSGSWLNSVKVVMGFLELAAALNFFRAGELVFTDGQPVF
ncbi:MAG: hypothetical protein JO112_10010, partial [Planctomycetes bacterium]|nr:hypothetical protein [Planctomycetota bacterium]